MYNYKWCNTLYYPVASRTIHIINRATAQGGIIMNRLATFIANGSISVEELASAKELIERAELVTKGIEACKKTLAFPLGTTKLGEPVLMMVRSRVSAIGAEIIRLAVAICRTLLKSLWLLKTVSLHMICVGSCFSRSIR